MTQRFRQEQEVRAPLRQIQVVPVTNVGTANVTLYTVPEERFFVLRHLGVANIAGANLAVTVHIVPSGGSASNSNKAYDAFVVWPNTTENLWALAGKESSHVLEPGDKIIAATDSATGGNFFLWGEIISGG